jgi:tRNA dimethylallyltransferase
MASQQILSVSDATSLEWPSTEVDGVWIFGPTASGKSSLALSIATSRPAVIINADASQLYAPLQVLSARPSAAECAQAPHALYGVLGAMEHASVTRWLALLAPAIAAARAEGKLPILVGGTGMYLGAALQGISPIPDIPTDVRDRLRVRLAAEGLPAMHAALLPAHSASAGGG